MKGLGDNPLLPLLCKAAPDLILGSVCIFIGPSADCMTREPSGRAGFTSSSGLEGIRGIVDDWMYGPTAATRLGADTACWGRFPSGETLVKKHRSFNITCFIR